MMLHFWNLHWILNIVKNKNKKNEPRSLSMSEIIESYYLF